MYLQWQGHLSTGQDALDINLRDITIADLGGQSFLYTSTGAQGGLTAYALDGGGGMATLLDQQYFNGQSAGAAAGVVEVVEIDGTHQLIFGSTPDDTLMSYELGSNGSIRFQNEIAPLSGAAGQIGSMAMADTADGLRFYVVDSDSGTLSVHSLPGGSGQQGMDPGFQSTAISFGAGAQIETVEIGSTSYLLATDQQAGAVISYAISASTGALTQVGAAGAAQGLGISVPTAMETVTAFGETWVVLGSAGSSSLSVMQLAADGGLTPVDHILDTLHTRFDDVTTLTVAQDGDRVFIVAGGSDDGLSVFTLAPDGRLIHLQTMVHTAGAGMENVSTLAATLSGDTMQVFASSGVTGGLTQFNIDLGAVTDTQLADAGARSLSGGAGQDMLVGSDIGYDTLSGGAGDDILIAGAAGARLTGGSGLDRFVIHADAAQTLITDFTPGVDQIDMSDFPMLRSVGQLTIIPQGNGARITFRDAVIEVRSAGGGPLDAGDLFPGGFVGPDRVLVLSPDADDIIFGTSGNDALEGTPDQDTLRGLDGADTITALGGADQVEGGGGGDLIFGGGGDDTLDGEAGDDEVWGGAGNDLVIGSTGNDTLGGGAGNDTLEGGDGNDEAWASGNRDLLYGGAGNDTLGGGTGDDTVRGETGDDVLWGGRNNDAVYGGAGHDVVGGGPGNDRLWGDIGNDTFWANAGRDTLWGGDGNDVLGAGEDNDLVYGEAGDDELRLGRGNDIGHGGDGADTLLGVNGDDTLWGGNGNDLLEGGNGRDALWGEADNDVLLSGNDADTLNGGAGNDTLWAGAGNDLITGGSGNDTLVGEAGADQFIFYANQGSDVIRDFTIGTDQIAVGSGAKSFAALTMVQQGSDTILTLGNTGTIRLEDVTMTTLGADDFIFI